MVEKELEAAKHRLPAPLQEGGKVRGSEEPVAVDGAEDREVAGREDHATDWRALEARFAGVDVGHRESG
ncbi:MAG TPA: hypothetical protein VF173_07265 [Thermoanaerobaculia bacterium]|nr:hypothetical protein [Thermoanaerobaculia bacterium]